ncbi:hypothetical protein ABFS83_01G090000 [Erythranthe nasuta]
MLLPSKYKRLPGRPKKSRRNEADEGQMRKISTMVKCRRCNTWGHNKRSCEGPQGQQAAREAQNNQENVVETQFQGSNNPQVAHNSVVQNKQVSQTSVIAQHPEVVPSTINANRKRQAKSVSRSDVSKQKKQKVVEEGQSAVKCNKPTSVSNGKKAASVSKENNEVYIFVYIVFTIL